ncbi:helix-turn-helix transcriptional regulator [Brevibacterium oceani]|uniref:helix-turn-helix transcriptional regulator n=1 Tax=Brevibacterium oceani TaxID=358099 RepID=UPI001FEB0AD7|nr:AraC family transcriptional regulator [Brevibacterium oceani]
MSGRSRYSVSSGSSARTENSARDDSARSDDAARGAWRGSARALNGHTVELPAGAPQQFTIIVESHYVAEPTRWEPHSHPAHELVWVRRGTMTARIGNRIFTTSEGFGLWIPAGQTHSGRLTPGIELFDAFFSTGSADRGGRKDHAERDGVSADRADSVDGGALDAAATPPPTLQPAFASATTVAMTPVLQSLLIHLTRTDLDPAARSRAEAVIFDVLEPTDSELAIAVPDDPRIAAITEAVIDDPGDERTIEDWAARLQVSARTITRAFHSSTGLSFARWRQAVRIHQAVELLGEGVSVLEVGETLGYTQTSTFIDAFRRVMGMTPGAFVSRTSL